VDIGIQTQSVFPLDLALVSCPRPFIVIITVWPYSALCAGKILFSFPYHLENYTEIGEGHNLSFSRTSPGPFIANQNIFLWPVGMHPLDPLLGTNVSLPA
jgi:hypothetical protein